jgi:hypothetical protein
MSKKPVDLSTPIELPADPASSRAAWPIRCGASRTFTRSWSRATTTTTAADHPEFPPEPRAAPLIARLWHRNLILKARQLGFTTLVCILWLDHALFNANQRCGIVAHDKEAAAANIFRDKVKFGYEQLPARSRSASRIVTNNASEILFSNNSSIRVATSMRSGTIHRLHVSEYGKICAKLPAQGRRGDDRLAAHGAHHRHRHHRVHRRGPGWRLLQEVEQAQALHDKGKPLTPKDFRFHFYAWWQEPKYRMAPRRGVHARVRRYFRRSRP